MKAKFEILPNKHQEYILFQKNGWQKPCYLWEGIIGHCSRILTNREMVGIYKQLSIQLNKDKDDIPFVFWQMFEEFKLSMKQRNVRI